MAERPLTEAEIISLRRSAATATLAPQQVERLFDTIERLRKRLKQFGVE